MSAIDNQLAEDHFDWFIGLVKKRFGRSAEEHAGPAFMRVLKYYDPVKGDFRAFASSACDNAVRSEFSLDHGKAKSKKRQAKHEQIFEDSASVAEERHDDICDVLRSIDDAYESLRKRSAAVCKVLGLFDDGDTAFILNRRSARGAI